MTMQDFQETRHIVAAGAFVRGGVLHIVNEGIVGLMNLVDLAVRRSYSENVARGRFCLVLGPLIRSDEYGNPEWSNIRRPDRVQVRLPFEMYAEICRAVRLVQGRLTGTPGRLERTIGRAQAALLLPLLTRETMRAWEGLLLEARQMMNSMHILLDLIEMFPLACQVEHLAELDYHARRERPVSVRVNDMRSHTHLRGIDLFWERILWDYNAIIGGRSRSLPPQQVAGAARDRFAGVAYPVERDRYWDQTFLDAHEERYGHDPVTRFQPRQVASEWVQKVYDKGLCRLGTHEPTFRIAPGRLDLGGVFRIMEAETLPLDSFRRPTGQRFICEVLHPSYCAELGTGQSQPEAVASAIALNARIRPMVHELVHRMRSSPPDHGSCAQALATITEQAPELEAPELIAIDRALVTLFRRSLAAFGARRHIPLYSRWWDAQGDVVVPPHFQQALDTW